MDFITKIFSPTKPTSLNQTSLEQSQSQTNIQQEATSPLSEVQKLRSDFHKKEYKEDEFKEICKQLLEAPDSAKYELANLALDFQWEAYQQPAAAIFSVLDEKYSTEENRVDHAALYKTLEGLKTLADKPDCGAAAFLYALELMKNTADPNIEEIEKYSSIARTYGYQFAYDKTFISFTSEETGKALTNPDTYIQRAKSLFGEGKQKEAKHQLELAAPLKGGAAAIVELAKEFELQENPNLSYPLICYEIAAVHGNQEAEFRLVQIKANQGDKEQQFQLAKAYFFGGPENRYPAKDLKEGLRYLQMAVKGKHADATFFMAEMFCNGYILLTKSREDTSKTKYIGSHDLYIEAPNKSKLKALQAVHTYLKNASTAGNVEAKLVLAKWQQAGSDVMKICSVWQSYRDQIKQLKGVLSEGRPQQTNVTSQNNTTSSVLSQQEPIQTLPPQTGGHSQIDEYVSLAQENLEGLASVTDLLTYEKTKPNETPFPTMGLEYATSYLTLIHDAAMAGSQDAQATFTGLLKTLVTFSERNKQPSNSLIINDTSGTGQLIDLLGLSSLSHQNIFENTTFAPLQPQLLQPTFPMPTETHNEPTQFETTAFPITFGPLQPQELQQTSVPVEIHNQQINTDSVPVETHNPQIETNSVPVKTDNEQTKTDSGEELMNQLQGGNTTENLQTIEQKSDSENGSTMNKV